MEMMRKGRDPSAWLLHGAIFGVSAYFFMWKLPLASAQIPVDGVILAKLTSILAVIVFVGAISWAMRQMMEKSSVAPVVLVAVLALAVSAVLVTAVLPLYVPAMSWFALHILLPYCALTLAGCFIINIGVPPLSQLSPNIQASIDQRISQAISVRFPESERLLSDKRSVEVAALEQPSAVDLGGKS